jgi:transposase, IS5 family
MRVIQNDQIMLGEIAIKDIKLDAKSRDDVPQILKGLQYIYTNDELRNKVFAILEQLIPENISKKNGRPGMHLWRVFVLGVLRLNLNWDYDRLHDRVNNHKTIRAMLGHAEFDEYYYQLQTIEDNIKLFTPKILDEINQVVIEAGHGLIKKKDSGLRSRCDSFVVKTNVHFPTDINLLFDAMRKSIELIGKLCEHHEISDWRQYRYNINRIKRLYRYAQTSKNGGARTEEQKQKREQNIKDKHLEYIDLSLYYLTRINKTINELAKLPTLSTIDQAIIVSIDGYMKHANRQIDQIRRRIIQGETIPHSEKVFSLFEPHTEWICKNKLGIPVELGLKVCILEDQYQFILHHKVMRKESDDKVAVAMAEEAKLRYPDLYSTSYDRGFFTQGNRETLKSVLSAVAMPKKGKLSKQDHDIESKDEYIAAKQKHSAIESAINALDVHGLDKCPDHGLIGFDRYVALAIVARNLQRLGAIIHKKDQRLLVLRERRLKKAA